MNSFDLDKGSFLPIQKNSKYIRYNDSFMLDKQKSNDQDKEFDKLKNELSSIEISPASRLSGSYISKFPCEFCKGKFPSLAQLELHSCEGKSLELDRRRKICLVCDKKFDNKIEMYEHMEKCIKIKQLLELNPKKGYGPSQSPIEPTFGETTTKKLNEESSCNGGVKFSYVSPLKTFEEQLSNTFKYFEETIKNQEKCIAKLVFTLDERNASLDQMSKIIEKQSNFLNKHMEKFTHLEEILSVIRPAVINQEKVIKKLESTVLELLEENKSLNHKETSTQQQMAYMWNVIEHNAREVAKNKEIENCESTFKSGSHKSEEGKLCVVCLDGFSTHIIVKCGHVCLCEKCALKMTFCPICRITYTENDLVKVFM
jgi:hypothetical protein